MPAQIHEKLASFAADRDESCFGQVVEEFSGVVFNGALRRTGDRQLAEEVAQNVFAIAARKARSLSRHPQLTAWFHTTTRFEASKAMQSRRRYKKRIEKLADEMNSITDTLTVEEQQSWRDALPHLDESLDHLSPIDREIVYGRFFEDHSFKEIAQRSGSSEAACKMRLKRSLGKLNRWLTGRGVTLSAAALASGLAAEFSKAAPAAVSAALPSSAIAASSGVTFATVLTNTVNTMSTIKSASIAATAVLLLGAIPSALQHSKANSLKSERDALRSSVARHGMEPKRSIHDRNSLAKAAKNQEARPVARFLAELEEPIVVDELIDSVTSAMMSQDMGAMMRIMLPLSKMSPQAGKKLIADVRASEKRGASKEMVLQFISTMVNRPDPDGSPGEHLDQQLADGVSSMNLSNYLGDWVDRDPDAAIAWFVARRDSGQLAGTGTGESSDKIVLFSGLMEGLSRSHSDRALALLEAADEKFRVEGIASFVPRLSVREEKREQALALVNSLESVDDRGDVVRRTADLMRRRGMEEAALAFAYGSNLDDENLASVIARLAIERGGEGSKTWADRVDWAERHVPDSARDELIGDLVNGGYLNYPSKPIATWIDSLPEGSERDAGLAAQSSSLSITNDSVGALDSAEAIGNETLRNKTVRRSFIILNHNNAAAAEKLAAERGLNLKEILK